MPVVISGPGSGASSTLQTLTVVAVYDYEFTPDNLPLVNAEISVWLAQAQATVQSVVLESKRQRVWTDNNGFWTVNLVPNLLITPAGTYYVVRTPQRTYRFTIPGGTGPFQASANPAP